jgi:7-cyano-7-deazaguanine synthase
MRIVALSSGGLDSSVMMLLLKRRGHELLPLFVDYGQLARRKEWEASKGMCSFLGLDAHRIDIHGFGEAVHSGITDPRMDISREAFLPTRNLLFLTIGSAYGYANSAYVTAIGLLSNPIFPDQTVEFIKSAENAVSMALGVNARVLAPLMSLSKVDILRLASKYGLPSDKTYSCHSGEDKPCGRCISCQERLSAQKYLKTSHD